MAAYFCRAGVKCRRAAAITNATCHGFRDSIRMRVESEHLSSKWSCAPHDKALWSPRGSVSDGFLCTITRVLKANPEQDLRK